MDDIRRNAEGYYDPTAHAAISNVSHKTGGIEKTSRDEAAEILVKTIKNMVRLAGFKLADRIKIEDPKSGKKYL